MLDPYSLIKAERGNTQLFNVAFEKPIANTKGKVSLTIFQLDYLVNNFIPFINSLSFQSKKILDFIDFCQIADLIYQGKHFMSEFKIYILQLSYTMNNYRLSTNTHLIKNLINKGIIIADYNLLANWKSLSIYLSLPPHPDSQLIAGTYVYEVITFDKNKSIYPTLLDCANALSVSRSTIYRKLKDKNQNSKFWINKGIKSINKIRVFLKTLKN